MHTPTNSNLKPYSVVVLDIEGTTTPITFVADTLFPYVRHNVEKYLKNNWTTETVQKVVQNLRDQAKKDVNEPTQFADAPQILEHGSDDEVLKSVLTNLTYNMDKDRKMTALKELQGHIWDSAYKTGEIKGFVYDDVFLAFNEWKSNNVTVYIYSSGSVLAQKLLFGHSNQQPADLLPFLSGHYDTVFPGSKVEATSYEKIVQDINVNSSDVLFATDNILEAEAAKQAGVQAVLAIRPGNKELPEKHVFATVTSFDQLL